VRISAFRFQFAGGPFFNFATGCDASPGHVNTLAGTAGDTFGAEGALIGPIVAGGVADGDAQILVITLLTGGAWFNGIRSLFRRRKVPCDISTKWTGLKGSEIFDLPPSSRLEKIALRRRPRKDFGIFLRVYDDDGMDESRMPFMIETCRFRRDGQGEHMVE